MSVDSAIRELEGALVEFQELSAQTNWKYPEESRENVESAMRTLVRARAAWRSVKREARRWRNEKALELGMRVSSPIRRRRRR